MTGRAAALALAVVASSLWPAPARAQTDDGDYSIDSDRWNGLSTLVAIADGMGIRATQSTLVDWEDLRSTIVLVLYPMNTLNARNMMAFIRRGGRVLIGDDFGESSAALSRLGILRGDGVGVDALRFHDEHRWAPIARALAPAHPLAEGVTELATNHPAILTSVQGADVVFGFGAGEGLVAAGERGSGRFVVTSDPSVLINRMMQFEGNFNFAINALHYLGQEGTDRMVVLAGDFILHGQPSDSLDDDATTGIEGVLEEFDNWLHGLSEWVFRPFTLRVLIVVFAIFVGVIVLGALPLSRKSPLDGSWIRAGTGAGIHASFESIIGHFDTDDARRDFALPASVLRDSINTRLARAIETDDPLHSLGESELWRRLEQRELRAAVDALRPVYGLLRAVPARAQASSDLATAALSRREFERLHSSAQQLYRSLGEE